jgi:hypothetical protein
MLTVFNGDFFKYVVHEVEKNCHEELKYNIKIIVICSAVLIFCVPYTAENISNGYYPHFSFIVIEREEQARKLKNLEGCDVML